MRSPGSASGRRRKSSLRSEWTWAPSQPRRIWCPGPSSPPIDHQSAGKNKGASTGKGNPWLAATIGEAVAAVARTDTFLGERYRRLIRRRGKKRAIVALGNSMLTIIWHLLSDPDARYRDLGSGFCESKINRQRKQRDLLRQLEHLTGHKVILEPRPSIPAA
jgi:transposase